MAAITATLLSAPAQAAFEWSRPHQLAPPSAAAWAIQLSDDGSTAIWASKPKGQKRAWYSSLFRGAGAGWSKPRRIFRSVHPQVEALLSGDGDSVLLATGDSYRVAKRTSGNRWSAPAEVARSPRIQGQNPRLGNAQMSDDGDVLVWIDNGTLLSRIRSAEGVWGVPQVVGKTPGDPFPLSGDGSTTVWVNPSNDLVSASRSLGAAWGTPALIQQHPAPPKRTYYSNLQLAADGTRALWQTSPPPAWATATRTAAGWTVPEPAASRMKSAVMTPDGTRIIATTDRGTVNGTVRTQRYRAGRWTTPKKLAAPPVRQRWSPPVVSDGALAWQYCAKRKQEPYDDDFCATWAVAVSPLRHGQWRPPSTIAVDAYEPVLSRDGRSLAWIDPQSHAVLTVHG